MVLLSHLMSNVATSMSVWESTFSNNSWEILNRLGSASFFGAQFVHQEQAEEISPVSIIFLIFILCNMK